VSKHSSRIPTILEPARATSKIDHFTSASAHDFIFGFHGDGEDWFLNACFLRVAGAIAFVDGAAN
jgi:hypothetical protein